MARFTFGGSCRLKLVRIVLNCWGVLWAGVLWGVHIPYTTTIPYTIESYSSCIYVHPTRPGPARPRAIDFAPCCVFIYLTCACRFWVLTLIINGINCRICHMFALPHHILRVYTPRMYICICMSLRFRLRSAFVVLLFFVFLSCPLSHAHFEIFKRLCHIQSGHILPQNLKLSAAHCIIHSGAKWGNYAFLGL